MLQELSWRGSCLADQLVTTNSALCSSDGISTSSTTATTGVIVAISGSFNLWGKICGHDSGVEAWLEAEAEDDVRDDEQSVKC
jgi:hypothetical protein